MKKNLLIAGTTLAVGLSTLAGVGVVHAANTPTTSTTSMSGLVNKIATKFNLKTADVQAVFDQDHVDHQSQMEANQKTQLDQAVKDGKLTQAQEDYIINAQKEIRSAMGSTRPDQQDQTTRKVVKEKINALKKWVTDNKIDEQYVHVRGHGHGPDSPGPM